MATYTAGEIEMQIKMKMPHDYPMKSVEVELGKQLKLPEKKLRKWVLSIKKML